ncbi:hypothetical protein LCGC14_2673260, partial [marine sediment metagenome]
MNYNKWKKFKHIKLKPNNPDDMVTKSFANKINYLPKEVRSYSIELIFIISFNIFKDSGIDLFNILYLERKINI